MANIGEVTAVLRARTEQFTAPVAKASASLNALRGEFATTRTQIEAAQTRLAQVATTTTAVGVSAGKARQGIGTMRSALGSLTARLVGVNGTMGTFLGAVGQFAFGNAATLGIIAGIGAMAFAFRNLGKAAREAQEEFDEMLRRAERNMTKFGRVGLTNQLAFLRLEQQRLSQELLAATAPTVTGGLVSPRARDIGQQLDRIIATIHQYEAALRGLDTAAKPVAETMRELSVASERFGETMRQAGEEVLAKVGIGVMRSVQTEAEKYAEKVNEITLRLQLGKISQEAYGETLRRLHAEFNQTATAAERAAVNIQAIQFAVESLINRLIHGGGFSILGALSGAIFGFLQGGPAGGVLGGIGGGFGVPGLGNLPQAIPGLSRSVTGGATVATIKMEPSVNPYVVANNAEWQRAIAETNRALARGGHRIAVVGG